MAQSPARVSQHVQHRAQRRPSRRAVVAPVPFAAAEHVGIGGEHQRLVARGGRAADDVACDAAVLHDIQLQPQPPAGARGDVLEARRREGAEREGDAEGGRCAGQGDVTVRVQHAVEAGRGDDERGIRLAPEDRAALVACAGVDQRLRHEPPARQRLAVAAEGVLVLRTALDVLEGEVRHAAAGELTQVGDVERARERTAAEGSAFPGHRAPRGALWLIPRARR